MILAVFTACGGSNSGEETDTAEKEARTADAYITVEEGGLSFQMPDYFGDPEMSGDVKNYYAEKGEGLSFIQMYSVDGLLSEDDFESDCKEVYDSYISGITDSEGVTDFRDGKSDDATLDCGLHCMLYSYSFNMSDVDFNGIMTLINNTESNKVVLVSMMQSSQSEYDYFDAYSDMIDKCEIIGSSANSGDDSSGSDSSLIDPEFKKTMDDYEAWFDHYCEVIKKCEENPSDLELLMEMTDLLTEETAMLEEMENMDQSDMNAAELAYYIEVTARIEKKLLEVAY